MFDGSILDNLPGILPKNPRSVITRYIKAHEEEVDQFGDILETAKKTHQIDETTTGTVSTGAVQFTVVEDALNEIKEGLIVEANVGGDTLQFETTETVDVGATGGVYWGEDWGTLNWELSPNTNTVTVEVDVQSLGTGTKYNVGANTITGIPNPPPGVQSVTNNSATSGGKLTGLDRIGAIFGELGQRGGRTDQQYRSYLKSLVPAFAGSGTIPSITETIAVGVGTTTDQVEIEEHFQDIEYSIILKDWQQHYGTTVEELADLADASVAQLRRVKYRNQEDVAIEDGVTVSGTTGSDEDVLMTESVTTSQKDVMHWESDSWNSNVHYG